MPPSQIAAYLAYYQPGVTRIYVCASIADINAPTRTELNNGLDVTRQVAEVEGWQVASEPMDRPDMASRFTSKAAGPITAEDAQLTFYGARTGIDVRQTLTRGYVGNVVFLDGGDTGGYKMDVYPVEIMSMPKLRGRGELFRIRVDFSITAEPAEDVNVPA